MSNSSDDCLKEFGAAIRMRRHELSISQEALAEAAGLHRTYVADIERGTRNLSLINIFKLANALGVRVSELFSDYVERKTNRVER